MQPHIILVIIDDAGNEMYVKFLTPSFIRLTPLIEEASRFPVDAFPVVMDFGKFILSKGAGTSAKILCHNGSVPSTTFLN